MDRRRERSCKWREISAEIPEFWVANMTPSEIKAAREKYNYVPARLIRAGVSVAADLGALRTMLPGRHIDGAA